MKILQLTAENVKRLKIVDITPQPFLNQITGENGNGKTSVLDSIWWALGGAKNVQSVPIRKGAESLRIRLDLGEMIVERKVTASGSKTLTVRNPVGAEPGTPDNKLPMWGSPQEMLDALVGSLSFDPLAFANMDPDDQYAELKKIVKLEVDIDALEAANDADFKRRTEINRDAKAKHAQVAGIMIPTGLPAGLIDESALLTSITEAASHNTTIETRKANREKTQRDANDKKAEGVRLRNKAADEREATARRVKDLQAEIALLEAAGEKRAQEYDDQATTALAAAGEIERKIDEAPALPVPIDIAGLRATLDQAKATNQQLARREQRDKIAAEARALDAQSAFLSKQMAERESQKVNALASAQMPVEGLSFERGRVMFNGLPFDQGSDAERLKVSVAIAMAMNPKIRVIRIRNGSLLDNKGIQMIADLAKERDYQIWMERVDDSGKIGIVMEDGEVARDNQQEAASDIR
jgi:AAA domain